MTTKIIGISTLLACIAITTGCAGTSRADSEFGDAVRQVMAAQVYDPNAAANPDPAAVVGGDPDRLNNSLDGYRKEAAAPTSVGDPITVNIGGTGN